MIGFRTLAEGLAFPEGPVALPDGGIALVEIAAGRITRIDPDTARKHTLATPGGGPNGMALGPDGALYVCNNGGFAWDRPALPGGGAGWRPVGRAADWSGGRIERVDPQTGRVERLYDACDGFGLRAPNDIVFDAHGGFWFTDHGHRDGRAMDLGAVYYARADGSAIRRAAFPLLGPNGIGLSPDGATLYVAETATGRLWRWRVTAPGMLEGADWPSPTGGELVAGLPGFQRYDSLAVEEGGNIVVATLRLGGLVVISPDGGLVERIVSDDPYTTNICLSGPDRCTAHVTLSGSGRLVTGRWPRPGLRLAHDS